MITSNLSAVVSTRYLPLVETDFQTQKVLELLPTGGALKHFCAITQLKDTDSVQRAKTIMADHVLLTAADDLHKQLRFQI